MSELTALTSKAGNGIPTREELDGSALYLLQEKQTKLKQNKFVQNLMTSWPIGLGILMALCAPMLADVLSIFKPWGMWLVFPFVELMGRPELHMGQAFQQNAPQIMLFLQFPLEGLMAKKFLRGQVTLRGVAGQVLFFHFLGVAQLWFVWRAIGPGGLH
jgi:hypothetical protein